MVPNAQEMRDEIDAALDRYTQFDSGCPVRLREAIRYSLLAPGKRLRPMLVLIATEACGSQRRLALSAACAVEMIHTYSLIHDDLPAMDNDDFRRGQPSCHAKFDETTAILAGDALLALAFEVLARDTQPAAVVARCCAELAAAAGATELVGGQADDLSAQFIEGSVDRLLAIHRRKTGALIRVSLMLGGLVAQVADEQLRALRTYGEKLGLAFQIVDDLLDVAGDPETVGKRTGKDSDRGKLTFPGFIGIEESRRRAATLVAEASAAIASFPQPAPLKSLAEYVLGRNR